MESNLPNPFGELVPEEGSSEQDEAQVELRELEFKVIQIPAEDPEVVRKRDKTHVRGKKLSGQPGVWRVNRPGSSGFS